MFFDLITWGIWSTGVIILIFWMIQTAKEFKILFSKQNKKTKEDSKTL